MGRISFRWPRFKKVRHHHVAHFEAVLGTSLELQLVAEDEVQCVQAENAVLAEIDRLEVIFNAYRPDSELRRWQQTFQTSEQVSSELANLLCEAEGWRIKTQGAFNPAVEAFTRLWKQHEQRQELIDASHLDDLLPQLNIPLWKVDREANVAINLTQLPVTLNAIAKGFIIDQACLVAAQADGVQEVLVNIGGDLKHFGSKPTSIAIANPYQDAENAPSLDRLNIWNQGLATSGNYRRGFQIGAQWYSHILDPRTGWPVEESVGVSVLAPNTAIADVLATAFSVLTTEASLTLANSQENIGVLLVSSDGTRITNAFWDQHRSTQA